MIPDNINLLGKCIQNPEPIYDPDYQKEYFIITDSPARTNELMQANRALLDLVTAYGVNITHRNVDANERIIEDMVGRLETRDMNTSEFTSFWECCDVSYSVFMGLSADEKRDFLRRITIEYLNRRHAIYSAHGYTATTLQVKADSFAHKRTGPQGVRKAERVFSSIGLEVAPDDGLEAVSSSSKWFILPDKQHREAFLLVVQKWGLRFLWSSNHRGKMPDYCVAIGGHLLISEHKHMKELGGGQDKQIVEISEFVAQHEDDARVHYVAFLDGILFNKLFDRRATGKVARQRDEIVHSLQTCPANYFVNSYGFEILARAFTQATS